MTEKIIAMQPAHPTADPAAFVAEAKRITNERDVAAISDVFAEDGSWTTVFNGLDKTVVGHDDIRARWQFICRFMTARRMRVAKQLVVCDSHTIVNEWTGTMGTRTEVRGIEIWQFSADGFVNSQRLYGFLNVGPEGNLGLNLRMLGAYPVTAAALGWARLHVDRLQFRAGRPWR